ncbi:hypothetical protein [Streptomyces litchfieldiae]|uniref:SPOR domain-containing protein n=1 Tax=Streptomyces litchfieldiae TaxID=3075543 RepID=A0ABU2MU33_9ACTN|nr:hypothetical protein [Streptomyces sp. DSM 44938]MDT0344594.1 hypothetical protein [Streptomyces sp. DSM 44938]
MAALFRRKATGRPGEWYYCLKHRVVEEGPECPAKDRLGPYATRTEAEHAIDTAHERNAEWRTDPRWNDEEADPGAGADRGGSP